MPEHVQFEVRAYIQKQVVENAFVRRNALL